VQTCADLASGTEDFFEACRRKRKVIDYDHISAATHTEAEEIVAGEGFFRFGRALDGRESS